LIKESVKTQMNTNTDSLHKEDKLNELALFAGAGGGILASELLGLRTVCGVEIEPYPDCVLVQRQNDGVLPLFPVWDNICTFEGKAWKGIVDVVSGGFPCQAFSTATHGNSTAADLWPEMRRVIAEVEPPIVFGENVSFEAISKAAEDCEGLGLGYRTHVIALSASDLGADHQRNRYWFIAYSNLRGKLFSSFNVQARELPELHPSIWSKTPEGWTRESVNERHRIGRDRQRKAKQVGETLAVRGTGNPSSESNRPGVVDGVAPWVDRYKAIGNGQVSAVAAAAFLIAVNFASKSGG
jgi:DNA (cytosine-5)-methyltransferase 1